MKSNVKINKFKNLLGVCSAAALISGSSALAQATFDGNYSQNFDGLGANGTTAPTGWSVYSEAGSHDTFSLSGPGYINGTGVNPNPTSGALTLRPTLTAQTTPSGTNANGLNYGVAAVTGVANDRALGTSPTGVAAVILELNLTNSTGRSLSSLSLNYDIDRLSTTTANNTAYNSAPNAGVEEFPGYWLYYSLNNGTSWTNVSSFTPTLATAPNSKGVTAEAGTVTLGNAWAANSNLIFAWVDDNAQSPSPDQLLGLNNVVVSAPEPKPVWLGLVALGALIAFRAGRRRIA